MPVNSIFTTFGGRLASFVALFAALTWLPASAQVPVSSGGQATTSVPIPVPPGIAGMVPNLHLQYVDGGISGHLGVGWSLQGISMITRCA